MKSRILITHILSPICFYIGHICSKVVFDYHDSYLLASVYQTFMAWSAELEDWCGKDIMWERKKSGNF